MSLGDKGTSKQEWQKAKPSVDVNVFTVEPSGFILSVSPVTSLVTICNSTTRRNVRCDEMEMKGKNSSVLVKSWHPQVTMKQWLTAQTVRQGVSENFMFSCHGGKAVNHGLCYTDNILSEYFLIRNHCWKQTSCVFRHNI